MSFLHKRKERDPKTGLIKQYPYYIQWRDHTGKLCRLSTGKYKKYGTPEDPQADEVHRQWKKDQSLGISSDISLNELTEEILAYVKRNLVSSYPIYKKALSLFAKVIGNKKVKLINVYDVETFKCERLKMHSLNQPDKFISPVTINIEVLTIKSPFNKAVLIGIINEHKIFKAKNIKVFKSNKRKRFTDTEKKLMMNNIKNESLRRTGIIAMYTGMRLNEILNLQIKDIDFNSREISIRNKPEINFKTKTSQERTIPVNEILFNFLSEWTGQLNNPDSFVINYKGNKYRKSTVSRKFVLALRKLNIDGSLHCLRHTFLSELAEKGVDIQTIKSLAGHSRLETTAIYLHSTNEAMFKAVNTLK